MTAATPALAVEDLTVRFGNLEANSDITFQVPQGSTTGLIGPNGAGKTTCFNAICGFQEPSEGVIRIHGETVPRSRPRAVWQHGVGRTFQRLELFWTLSVRENLELAARRARLALDRDVPDVDDLLALTGLGPVASSSAADVPMGTARLVELARALSTGADILLLDEASSGLDRRETAEFAEVVRHVRTDRDVSILLVEHDVEFVLDLADQVLVLDFGRLIASGTPDEIVDSDVVREVYLGRSAA